MTLTDSFHCASGIHFSVDGAEEIRTLGIKSQGLRTHLVAFNTAHLSLLVGALEVLIEMKNQDVKFNKDTYALAFAICYRLVRLSSLNF